MKILQVIPYFVPAYFFGGPVQAVYDVSKELVKRGHEIVVYTSDAKDLTSRLKSQNEKLDGITVHRFRNLSMFAVDKSKFFITLGMISKLRKEISEFDVIHLQEYRAFQSIISHMYTREYGKPLVLQAHGSVSLTHRTTRNKFYDILFGRSLLDDSSKVIALSEAEAQQYRRVSVPEDKIEIIPNGIALSEYSNLPRRGSFRKKFNIPEDKRIILYLGRIHRIKGIDFLVEAYARLLGNLGCQDVVLVIVGPDDGYLNELRALISDLRIEAKVLILGPLYGKDKIMAYVDTDLFALTSRYEMFPMSVLESLACGTPVVLTENSGITQYLGGKASVIVKPEPEHIYRALLDLMLHAEKIDLLRSNCRAVVATFEISKTAAKVEDVYKEITE